MLSFNNSHALKDRAIALAEHHAAADMLKAGTYGNDQKGGAFRGCSVGCFAHDLSTHAENDLHSAVARALCVPKWLVRLQDSTFEGLPAEQRAGFHVELYQRVPVGVDLGPVQHWIAIARIDRMLETQRKTLDAGYSRDVTEVISQVIAALKAGKRAHEAAAGGNDSELSYAARLAGLAELAAWSAESAAWSARSAARSAAGAAELAAWSAKSAAGAAAESAAWSAKSAARAAAESAAWIAERNALFAALCRAGCGERKQ